MPEDTGPSAPEEPWWKIARANRWLKFNIAAAGAVGVYLLVRADDVYSWLSDGPLYFATVVVVALVIAVPLIYWLRPRGQEVIGVWVVLETAVLGVATITAVGDAREKRHYHIDWKAAAEHLKQDYTEVEFEGATYLYR